MLSCVFIYLLLNISIKSILDIINIMWIFFICQVPNILYMCCITKVVMQLTNIMTVEYHKIVF